MDKILETFETRFGDDLSENWLDRTDLEKQRVMEEFISLIGKESEVRKQIFGELQYIHGRERALK